MKPTKTMFTGKTISMDTLRHPQTFQQVLEQFHQSLYRYFAVHTNGDLPCAQEMTAETFSILYRKPIVSGKESFSSWLFGIAWDVLNAYYGCEEGRNLLSTTVSPLSRCEFNDPELQKALKALSSLPFYPRETLYLRFFAGLDVKDIAILMDKSIAAIKVTIFQGLAEFAGQLNEGQYVTVPREQHRSLAQVCHLYVQDAVAGNASQIDIASDIRDAVDRLLSLRDLISMKPDAFASLVTHVEQFKSATRL
jgi:DNA-directed RNA polymerase specialized sigma24 family protein